MVDFTTDADAIARRRKIADAMMQQGQAPVESVGMAGGAPVPISWTQMLGKLAQAYVGGRGTEEADTAAKALTERRNAALTEAIGQAPGTVSGVTYPQIAANQAAEYTAPEAPPAQGMSRQDPFGPSGGPQGTAGAAGGARGAIVDAMTQQHAPTVNANIGQPVETRRPDDMASQVAYLNNIRSIDPNALPVVSAVMGREDAQKQARELIASKLLEAKLAREQQQGFQSEMQKDRFAQQGAMARLAAGLRPAPQPVAPTVVTNAAGDVTLLDRTGNVIKTLPGGGKPSATFEKTVAAKKKMGGDLDLAITELEKATKDGGLIDKSTGSGAGALVDMAAGFVGKSTPGAVAVGQMKPIYDMVLKMVPRFEGPQSDKDTRSYMEAAGQLANPAVPNDIKKTAGKEILRLMKQRKGQFIDKAMEGTEADTSPAATPTRLKFDANGNMVP